VTLIETNPTFTAALSPANENPAIVGAEAAGSGTATVTMITTKDAAGNVTAATATFVVNLSGFPAGTPINIAHIHQAAAGVNGSVVVNSGLTAGQNVLTTGSGSFTASNLTVDAALANLILTNPAGFYFNVHSTLNPGGVARGQLVRVQ
jgi:filamentous hemagglutinin family protein